jgi:hypothetical protein
MLVICLDIFRYLNRLTLRKCGMRVHGLVLTLFTMNAPAGMIAAATVRRLISACMDLYAGGVMHACVTCTYAAWSYCDKGSLCVALPCPIMVHHADLLACGSCVGTTVILCPASLTALSSFQKCLPPTCCKMNQMSLI